jgi:hypothetical protein
VVVDEDAAVLHRGLTSSIRYATRRVTRPRLVGGGSKMMMMTLLMTRRLMLPPTGWTLTGTPILVQQITSLASSKT